MPKTSSIRLSFPIELRLQQADRGTTDNTLLQGWANYACGPPEYIMRPVGTYTCYVRNIFKVLFRVFESQPVGPKLVPQFKNIIQNCEQLHSSH